MTLTAILTLAAAVFALAIKPGAGMMMVMSRAVSDGLKGVLAFMLGVNLVNMLFLGLVIGGLHLVSVDLVFISILVKSLAAVYLIWLGVKGLQNNHENLSIEEVEAISFFENLSSSIILTLSNPLVILFYAGILPTILDISAISWDDIFIIAFIIVIVETVVAVAYSAPLMLFRHKVSGKALDKMKILSSVVIIIVGLYIGYTAIPAKELLAVF